MLKNLIKKIIKRRMTKRKILHCTTEDETCKNRSISSRAFLTSCRAVDLPVDGGAMVAVKRTKL
jgi:hypothetical protein